MIRDLQLLKHPELLFEKKCIIWGSGKNGKMLYRNLLKLGVEQSALLLCDTNADKMGINEDCNVLSIEQMVDKVVMNKNEYMIIISVESMEVQSEIIEQIKENDLFDVDIYTLYAAKLGIIFGNRKKGIDIQGAELGIVYFDKETRMMQKLQKKLNYFMLALYLEQIILVHQPGKVGSTTICSSLENYNVYSLHLHNLQNLSSIRDIMQKRNGKIISAVRNPLEWKISMFWQMFEIQCFENKQKDFFELQKKFFTNTFWQQEFKWFDKEIKEMLGIDIFAYPFDKKRGYTIIKKDNIELLLMTCEKIDSLEEVIGDFVGISNFKLDRSNVGERKDYRFIYEQYKREFVIPKSIFNSICKDEYIRHFYTEEDIEHFRRKWENQVVEEWQPECGEIKIGAQ